MIFQKGPTPIIEVQKGNWLQCPIILAKNDSYISKREMQLLTGLASTAGMSEGLNIWRGQVVMGGGGYNLLLVEIGLGNLPKFEGAFALPAP